MQERLLTHLVVAAMGPVFAVTFLGRLDPRALLLSLLVAGLTAATSAVLHALLRRRLPATILSVLVSETLSVSLPAAYAYLMPAGPQRAEALVWLPLMLVLMAPFAFPTVLSVACGVGGLIADWGGFQKEDRIHRRNLAKRLAAWNAPLRMPDTRSRTR